MQVLGESTQVNGTASVSRSAASVGAYRWAAADGTGKLAGTWWGPTPTVQIQAAGRYTLTLTVWDVDGAWAAGETMVTVAAPGGGAAGGGAGSGSRVANPYAYLDGATDKTGSGDAAAAAAAADQPPLVQLDGPSTATAAVGSGPTAVTFDGSGTTDPDGDALTYSWSLDRVSAGGRTAVALALGSPQPARATLAVPEPGTTS